MLHRLALALLIACLAVPAMAAGCAGPAKPMAAATMHHHGSPAMAATPVADHDGVGHPSPQAASHDCIGCIAPLHGVGRLAMPLPAPEAPVSGASATLDSSASIPEPPPPRLTV